MAFRGRRMGKVGVIAWLSIALAVVLAGFLAWRPALRALGTFLVVDDGLRHADAVVVLSGDANRERLDTAVAIVRTGMAKWIIALTGTPPDFYDEGPAIRQYSERQGVGANRVIIAREVHSTADDAKVAAQVMNERGWRSAIVVTTSYHTRRAGWTFRRVWSPLGLSFAVHPSGNPRYDPQRWWEDDRNAEAVVLEYVKFAVYILRYGLFR